MVCANDMFPSILYLLGCILLIVLIILGIRLINTLNRVDTLIDDVNNKSTKLNGLFDIVDNTADALASVSDIAVGFITNSVRKVLNKRKKEDKENE